MTAIDIDSLFSCLVLRALRSLLRRSRRRPHGWLGEGIGSVVVAPFPVTLTMCVTVKANALNEERVRETDVDVRADTGRCCGIRTVTWQRLEASRNALVVSCGDVQVGDRGRSKETLRALACRRFNSSLPEGALLSTAHPARDATMVALTEKKNAKRRLPLHEKDLLRVGANVGSDDVLSSPHGLAADRVHSPVS